jgi:hypothetical protein
MIKALGLRSSRTIRAVAWTNEENGAAGGSQYALDFAAQLPSHSIVIECDEGSFQPYALGISGNIGAQMQIQLLGSLLAQFGAGNWTGDGGGTDIGPSCAAGVPCGALLVLVRKFMLATMCA